MAIVYQISSYLFNNYVTFVTKTNKTAKTEKSSRYVAAETLCQLFLRQQPVKPILNKVSQKCSLPTRERALAMNLVFGVLRKRQELDIVLRKLSSVRLKKIQPFVHQALVVGLYQLFFLENIPESAAVNEAVNSCKAAGVPKRLHGFVNGILRNAIRKHEELLELLQQKMESGGLYNHPDWLVERWINQFGQEETSRICTINNEEPKLILRSNGLKISQKELIETLQSNDITVQAGIAPDSIILTDYRGAISELPGYEDGFFQVQDSAAQLASLLLQPIRENGVYLDACAGLGGKTSHMIQLCAKARATVTAVEPDQERSTKFHQNMTRLFSEEEVELHTLTLEEFTLQNTTLFDGVLVDAPCSGTGVIRRHPDIRWNRTENDLLTNHNLQLEILSKAAKTVAPDGILIYATCSLEHEENDDIIELFLQQFPEFSLTDCTEILPSAAHQYLRELQTETQHEGNVFAPHPNEMIDGFFAARLIRQGAD